MKSGESAKALQEFTNYMISTCVYIIFIIISLIYSNFFKYIIFVLTGVIIVVWLWWMLQLHLAVSHQIIVQVRLIIIIILKCLLKKY